MRSERGINAVIDILWAWNWAFVFFTISIFLTFVQDHVFSLISGSCIAEFEPWLGEMAGGAIYIYTIIKGGYKLFLECLRRHKKSFNQRV